jgi:hypothetical protein
MLPEFAKSVFGAMGGSMRHRHIECAIVAAVCLLCALIAFAGPKEFWETKPYTEWTLKEVEKILLNKSPWTETHLLDTTPTSVQIGNANPGGGGRGGGEITTKVIINWFARPIREATVRQIMLQNPQAPPAQFDRILNRDPKFIELMITDLPLGRGGRGSRGGSGGDDELAKFKENTFLQLKNGTKIPVVNMVMPRGREAALGLQFAREIDGKPAITPEDQEVTLAIRIGEKNFKFKFKLADMMVAGKLEI